MANAAAWYDDVVDEEVGLLGVLSPPPPRTPPPPREPLARLPWPALQDALSAVEESKDNLTSLEYLNILRCLQRLHQQRPRLVKIVYSDILAMPVSADHARLVHSERIQICHVTLHGTTNLRKGRVTESHLRRMRSDLALRSFHLIGRGGDLAVVTRVSDV